MASGPATRVVRLFKNGRSQAVRIPREFELPGNEAMLRQDKNGRLILEPLQKAGIVELISSWDPLPKEEWMPAVEDAAPEPVDL